MTCQKQVGFLLLVLNGYALQLILLFTRKKREVD